MKKWHLSGVVFLAVFALGAAAAPAWATGPCGNDYNGPTACGVNSPYSTSQSLNTNNEEDWYVLHAQNGTQLHVTLTDTESSCNAPPYCTEINVHVYDANNGELGTAYATADGMRPGHVDLSVNAGTYYVVIKYDCQCISGTPYRLDISASPTVVWPYTPPSPSCVVPRYRRGERLAHVEHRILANHCTVAKVRRQYNRHVKAGRVAALSPTPGGHYPNGHGVSIIVSRGPRA